VNTSHGELIENAVKYNRPGGQGLSPSDRGQDFEIRISVRD